MCMMHMCVCDVCVDSVCQGSPGPAGLKGNYGDLGPAVSCQHDDTMATHNTTVAIATIPLNTTVCLPPPLHHPSYLSLSLSLSLFALFSTLPSSCSSGSQGDNRFSRSEWKVGQEGKTVTAIHTHTHTCTGIGIQ